MTDTAPRALGLASLALACTLLSACGGAESGAAPGPDSAGSGSTGSAASASATSSSSTGANTSATAAPPTAATPSGSAAPSSSTPGEPELAASDGKPRDATLAIPALDLKGLEVEAYRGTPDDAEGTEIQDGGIAASPYGSRGTVGAGGIGNYIITAHRSSSTKPFADLPKLRNGEKVHVTAGGKRYTYKIVSTRITSFRSKKSLAAQSAAVPGKPGVKATKAMITLSTCRTPEDHAEGNYWSDRFHNPEHRIDKIGELVEVGDA